MSIEATIIPREDRMNEFVDRLIEQRNGNFPFQLIATYKSAEAITPDILCQQAIVNLCDNGGGDLVLDFGLRNGARLFRFCYQQQTRHDETAMMSATVTEERLSKKRGRPPKSAYLPGGSRYIASSLSDVPSLQSFSIDTTDGSMASDTSEATLLTTATSSSSTTSSSSSSSSSSCYVPMSTWSNKKAVFGAILRIVRQQLTLSTIHAHLTESDITASAYKVEKLIFREALGLHLRTADAHIHYSNKNTLRERILRYVTEVFPTLTITPSNERL